MGLLEGLIERRQRTEAGVHGDREHRQTGLGRVQQSLRGLGYAVAIEKIAEVAIAKARIDSMPEPVLGYIQLLG